MVSLNVMFDWDTRIVIFDLEDLIEKQLQKNLLQVSDNQKYKFKLQLPYSYSVNTRLKYFPGYKLNNYTSFFYDGTNKNLSISKNNVDRYIFFRNKNTNNRHMDTESIKTLIKYL